MKNWFKARWLISIFISLCLLITIITEFKESARGASSPILIAQDYENRAMPAIPLRVSDDLSRTRRSEVAREKTTPSEKITSSRIHQLFNPSLYSALICSNFLGSNYRRGFQQACQLADIPPPSYLVS